MSLSRQMIDAVVMAITIVGLPWARAAFRPPKTIQSRLRRRETTDIYAARGARRNSGCPLARTTAVRSPRYPKEAFTPCQSCGPLTLRRA
jgi:hypothetical protein